MRLARREFLRACGALAAAATFAGCRTAGANLRLGADLADAPHPERIQPIVHALITTLLPCEDPAFPLPPRAVAARMDELFALEANPGLDTLRRALIVFDDVRLFPERLAVFTDAERMALHAGGTTDGAAIDAGVDRALARDADAYAAFARDGAYERFSALPLTPARDYVRLWAHSAFTPRRQFYRSGKTLVMLAAYSLPETWRAIGYDGPLLERS